MAEQLAGAHPKAATSSAEMSETFFARTEHAQQDLGIILNYVTQRTRRTPFDRALVEEAVVLCATPAERLSVDQAKRIWSLMDEFSSALQPATIEGLRLTDCTHRAPHVSYSLKWGAVVTLIITILVQGYAIFGAQAIDGIDRAARELQQVQNERNRMHEAQPALLDLTLEEGAPAPQTDEERQSRQQRKDQLLESAGNARASYQTLVWRQQALEWRLRGAYHTLYQWNALWAKPMAWLNGKASGRYWPCEHDTPPDPALGAADQCDDPGDQIRYGTESHARALLIDVQTLVLPVFYSMLGAWVWLLRGRLQRIRERNLRPVLPGEHVQRILLGAVLGGVIGVFYADEDAKSYFASIPLLGLAFLAGYNVEIIFSIFDRWINLVRQQFSGEAAEARGRRGENPPPPAPSGPPPPAPSPATGTGASTSTTATTSAPPPASADPAPTPP